MRCPLCTDTVLEPNRRGGIEVDVCPRCRGVWLDRGELERLVDRGPGTSGGDRRQPDAPFDERAADPADRHRDPRRDRKRRLSDRLGDVFDDLLDF